MSQLNIYVPNSLETIIRREAQIHRKTLSAYLAEIIKNHFQKNRWQKDFFKNVCGQWDGDFSKVEDLTAEERDSL